MAGIEENIDRLGGLRPILGEHLVPMSEEETSALERQIGARLPEGYRRFLRTYGTSGFNAFVAFKPITPFPAFLSSSGDGIFSLFYGAATHDVYSVIENIDTFRDQMPETMIPIGDDGLGDRICLCITGPDRGKIYYWDASEEGLEEDYTDQGLPVPPDLKFRNVHLVAGSFEEFLDQMYVNEDV